MKVVALKPLTDKYKLAFKAILCLAIFQSSFIISKAQSETAFPGDQHLITVKSIEITGNKITRDHIILREIIFKPGESINILALDSMMERSRENLMNTLLFNFVYIDRTFAEGDSSLVNVKVDVTERWYIWPTPILKINDRNFNVWWQTKDFSRLSYGFYIDWKNFRGRKENLIFKFQWGYERNFMVQYLIPYLNRKKTLGMGFGFGLSRQREAAYQTIFNKQEFYKDTLTYALQDWYAYGQFVIRMDIYNSHQFELRYDQHHFSDSLLDQNINYTIDSADELKYISFSYLFKSDHRDFKSYPLKGYYFDAGVLKHGLWTFNTNTLNTFEAVATFRKYWQLHPRFYYASGINAQVSAGLHPYFILGGIGFDRDVIRSYEYYLVNARHFAIWKNNVKFAIIPTTVKEIKFIKSDKFGKVHYALYMNVFVDAGYSVYNQDFGKETNDLQNSFLLGYGAGLDFVTYYDVVMRFEFSVNLKNETGFFLHFRAPI